MASSSSRGPDPKRALPVRIFIFASGLQLSPLKVAQRTFCAHVAESVQAETTLSWDASVCLMRVDNMGIPAHSHLRAPGRGLTPADAHDLVCYPEDTGPFPPADADVVLLLPEVSWLQLRPSLAPDTLLQPDSLLSQLMLAVATEIRERGATPLFLWTFTPQTGTNSRTGARLGRPASVVRTSQPAAGDAGGSNDDVLFEGPGAEEVGEVSPHRPKRRRKRGKDSEEAADITEEEARILERTLAEVLKREPGRKKLESVKSLVTRDHTLRAQAPGIYVDGEKKDLTSSAAVYLEGLLGNQATLSLEEVARGEHGRHMTPKQLLAAIPAYLRHFAKKGAGMAAVLAEKSALRGEQCLVKTPEGQRLFAQQAEELINSAKSWRAAGAVVVACEDLLEPPTEWSQRPPEAAVRRLCWHVGQNEQVQAWATDQRKH